MTTPTSIPGPPTPDCDSDRVADGSESIGKPSLRVRALLSCTDEAGRAVSAWILEHQHNGSHVLTNPCLRARHQHMIQ